MRFKEKRKPPFCICNSQGQMFSKDLNYKDKKKTKTLTASTDLSDANHNRIFPKIEQNKTKLNPVNVLRFYFIFFLL